MSPPAKFRSNVCNNKQAICETYQSGLLSSGM